jgi:hypothetical protein
LVPYYSQKFALPNKWTKEQANYLKNRFKNNLEFIKSMKVKYLIFNGKPYENLITLLYPKIYKSLKWKRINDKTKLTVFKLGKIKCIMFSWQFTAASSGITDNDLYKRIPKIIERMLSKAL